MHSQKSFLLLFAALVACCCLTAVAETKFRPLLDAQPKQERRRLNQDEQQVRTKAHDAVYKDEERSVSKIFAPSRVAGMVTAVPRAIGRGVKGAFKFPGSMVRRVFGKEGKSKRFKSRDQTPWWRSSPSGGALNPELAERKLK